MSKLTLLSILTAIGLSAIAGCSTTQVISPFQNKLDSLGITTNEIRLDNIEKCRRIAIVIEHAADSIVTLTDKPQIRQNARSWKMSVVPAFRQMLLFGDPVAAVFDGFAYSVQIHQYLEAGKGKTLFGDQQSIAVRCADDVESLFPSANKRPELVRAINAWASQHPIQNELFDRASVIPDLPELRLGTETSVFGAVGDISQNVRDLSDRLNLYAMQVPREARWQAEYLVGEMKAEERIDSLELLASSLTAVVHRLASAVEKGEITVDIRSLRLLHDDIDRLDQRIETERGLILSDVNRQRLETISEVERIINTILQNTTQRATEIVDHLMLRVAEIVGVAICVVGVFVIVGVFILSRRKISTRFGPNKVEY